MCFLRLLRANLAVIVAVSVFSSSLGRSSLDDLDAISFRGAVRDEAGSIISFARVTVRNVASGIEKTVACDEEGRYRIVLHEPGDYLVRANADGFREEKIETPAVVMGRTVRLDIVLYPETVKEQITVAATDPAAVDTSRTVSGDTITIRELESLPIPDRNPLQLVFLLGGVADAPLATSDLAEEGRGQFVRQSPEEAGLLSLTGAPATSNNITIDGLDNNDDRSARERMNLPPEAIAEVQVITNQYAAEYGRASGGRINIRTRGGANAYRADAYAYFADESLNANSFYRNARSLGRIPQQQRRAGGSYSGPLRRGRHFFHTSYERLHVTDSEEIRALLPVRANPLFPLPKPNQPLPDGGPVGLLIDELSTPEDRHLLGGRVDFNFNQSQNLAIRLDLLRGANRRGFPGGTRLAETITSEGRDSDSISASHNFVLSSRAINQARLQYSRLRPRNSAAGSAIGLIIEEPGRVVAGAFTGSSSSPAFAREEIRLQAQESLSILTGNHQLKLGADIQLVRSEFKDLFATGGQYTFDDVASFLASRPSRFIQRFDTESRISNDVAGLFIQDEWKIRPGLTLSFGARWDNEAVLEDRNNFSPRLAVAWDPFSGDSSGRTVVRAGFGIFYNRALLRTLDDFSLGRTTITIDSEISPGLLSIVRFPDPISERSMIERFGLKETEFLRRVSPDLEVPYTIQTGLGAERRIGSNMVATADYIFTRGAHLWRETNINAPVLPAGFASFTEYLLSRDFDNRPGADSARPIAATAADVVRFDLSGKTSSTPGALVTRNGLRILTLGLNAPRSSNIRAALNALRSLRPDPSLTQVELLESTGNSFYHGGVFSIRYNRSRLGQFRFTYTLSKFIDEGTTNTASAQDLADRQSERALSLQDQRHRLTLSGSFKLPVLRFELSPVLSFGSSRPFNIGSGFDRNLNDIENDRPDYTRPLERPRWRRPGDALDVRIRDSLKLAPIGSTGWLPRNYGRGPGTRTINLRASRQFNVSERVRLRVAVDAFNLFNNTIFSFGSEFINRDDDDFLVPRRTQRPRTLLLSAKIGF
ncbi:MAG TPA: TonB-dependent receptor [Blastocatellia bacterium]|nr:TonB-dependent receptor [Blastocatellia bacterium]